MSKWQYESDITPSTITITDLVNQDWVMRITPDRKIEVNEDVEVTEAAQKVLDVIQEMMDRQKPERNGMDKKVWARFHQWQGLTDDEMAEIIGHTVEFCYESGMMGEARAIEQALKEKNYG